ncbi:50S ribosomal protein L24 [Candidatus Nanohaloarchaea archaeon]|nr:50S ribosomal protein L24 [Candidatus Nanohaloarchaea archaeon]
MSNNEWSRSWNSSKNPTKQRKYRRNAPQHVKDKLVSANLASELREELGTRNLNLKVGDRVEIMRGDDKGTSGVISSIDRENGTVTVNGVENERTDGTSREKTLQPSNLQIQALNLENVSRIEAYDVEDTEAIEVDEEELEELEEEEEENAMMQQMQGGGEAADISEEELEEIEEEIEEEETEAEEEKDTESEEDSDETTEESDEESEEKGEQ